MNFNINEYVRVRLTRRGREILATLGRDPEPEPDGMTRFQFWDLAITFGPTLGFNPPFEGTIEFEPLTWTNTPPTAPGWYWHEPSAHPRHPRPTHVWINGVDGSLWATFGGPTPLRLMPGRWAGPIEQPTEP